MSNKQAAALVAIESLGKRTYHLERALDTGPSLEACKRAGSGAQWVYEKILELPVAAEAKSVLRRGGQTIGRHSNLNSKPVHVFLRERER